MPALKPTTYSCEIVYLGVVPDREAALASDSQSDVFASFAGAEGECHAGLTRPSCSRVLSQHPRGTEIRNARQFSIVSAEELDLIAAEIGLDSIDPEKKRWNRAIREKANYSRQRPRTGAA